MCNRGEVFHLSVTIKWSVILLALDTQYPGNLPHYFKLTTFVMKRSQDKKIAGEIEELHSLNLTTLRKIRFKRPAGVKSRQRDFYFQLQFMELSQVLMLAE